MARKYFTLIVLLMMSTWAFGQSFDYSISTDASAHEGGGNTALEVEPPPEVIVYGTTFPADGSGFQLNMPGSSTMQDMGESLSSSGGLFNSVAFLGGMMAGRAALQMAGHNAIDNIKNSENGYCGQCGWLVGMQGGTEVEGLGLLRSGVGSFEGGIPLPESMRNFSDKDLLLGEFSQLPEFKAWGGFKGRLGKVGADPDFIIPQIRSTRAFGGTVRFNLKGFSIRKAMDPKSMWYWEASQNYTSKEYHSIITHWEDVKDVVLFYTGPYPY